jgi:hypothetical protein
MMCLSAKNCVLILFCTIRISSKILHYIHLMVKVLKKLDPIAVSQKWIHQNNKAGTVLQK